MITEMAAAKARFRFLREYHPQMTGIVNVLRDFDRFAAGAKECCFSSMAKHRCRESPLYSRSSASDPTSARRDILDIHFQVFANAESSREGSERFSAMQRISRLRPLRSVDLERFQTALRGG